MPRRLLEQRLGRKVIRDEVIRDALGDYYQQAVDENDLDTIASPEIDITAGEEEGPLQFDAVVEVRPRVSIIGYQGLQVTLPQPYATDEEVQAQLDRMRENFAELNEVERAAEDGDNVTIDLEARRDGELIEGLSADDLVYELGSDSHLPGLDELLRGAKAGDEKTLELDNAPGGAATVDVKVKLVREKVLPELTDEWASEASEFSTLEELRSDLTDRISAVKRLGGRRELRQKAVEALIELVTEDPPEVLVAEETDRRIREFVETLANRQISVAQYLGATGTTEEEFVAEQERGAAVSVKADLALRSLADAEQIEVSDEELDEEVGRMAAALGEPVKRIRDRLEASGSIAGVRSELRKAKSVTWLTEHVEIVDDQGNPVDRTALLEEDEAAAKAEEGAAGATLDVDEPAPERAEQADETAEEG